MRRLLAIAAVVVLASAKPELYKENEDFQYSRSSSDEGHKSGYYGAQRGNMGGNYEKSHNMDLLAQHQMGGAVRQVEGELGDGVNTKTGSVFTSGNSRGMYGAGRYDTSALAGRNFNEGVSVGDSHSAHSSLSSHDAHSSQYTGSHLSGYTGSHGLSSGYQTGSLHSGNLQTAEAAGAGGYDYEHNAQHSSGYEKHSGFTKQSSHGYGSNAYTGSDAHTRMVGNGVPARVVIRPGTTVYIPVAAQTYQHASLHDQNAIDSDTEVLSSADHNMHYSPSTDAKSYESSYSYRKEWEKHHGYPYPTAVPLAVPTINPYPKNSELYEDALASSASHNALSSSHYDRYNSNVKSSSAMQSHHHSGYNAAHDSASSLHSNAHTHGALNSDSGYTGDTSSNPKSYQSSYAYHKSWERQGDPYVIIPSGDGQSSGKLTDASDQYGSHSYTKGKLCCVDTDGHIRVARSYNQNQQTENLNKYSQNLENFAQQAQDLTQQSQTNWKDNLENFGQQTQDLAQKSETKWNERLEDLGQQTQDLAQQSQTNWNENLEKFGQQTQDLTQQSQNKWNEHLEDLGQRTQDLAQQSQTKWNENLENFGRQTQDLPQQSQTNWKEKFENFGQQTQDLAQRTQDSAQQSQTNWKEKFENFGQQTQDLAQQSQNKWNEHLEDLGQRTQDLAQQSQTNWKENLENFGQQTQDLAQQSQTKWNEHLEDFGQQTQDLAQQTENRWDKFTAAGQQTESQQTQDKWNTHTTGREDEGQHSHDSWKLDDFGQSVHATQQHKINQPNLLQEKEIQAASDNTNTFHQSKLNSDSYDTYTNWHQSIQNQDHSFGQETQGMWHKFNTSNQNRHFDSNSQIKPVWEQTEYDRSQVSGNSGYNNTRHSNLWKFLESDHSNTQNNQQTSRTHLNDTESSSQGTGLVNLWNKINNLDQFSMSDNSNQNQYKYSHGYRTVDNSFQNNWSHSYSQASDSDSSQSTMRNYYGTQYGGFKPISSSTFNKNTSTGKPTDNFGATDSLIQNSYDVNFFREHQERNSTTIMQPERNDEISPVVAIHPQDIGRGDIGPEESFIYSVTQSTKVDINHDNISPSTVSYAFENKRNKTPEEIETLSLTTQTEKYVGNRNTSVVKTNRTEYNNNQASDHTLSVLSIQEWINEQRKHNQNQYSISDTSNSTHTSGTNNPHDFNNKKLDTLDNNKPNTTNRPVSVTQHKPKVITDRAPKNLKHLHDEQGTENMQQETQQLGDFGSFIQEHRNFGQDLDQQNQQFESLGQFEQQNYNLDQQVQSSLGQDLENFGQQQQSGWDSRDQVQETQQVEKSGRFNEGQYQTQDFYSQRYTTNDKEQKEKNTKVEDLQLPHSPEQVEEMHTIHKTNAGDTETVETPIPSTEKPGFWKSVGSKFSSAKDTVASWFKKT